MADLIRRPRTRAERVQRGHNLVVTSAGAGLVAVVSGVLALVGVIGWTIPMIALIVCVVAAFVFRGMISRRR